MNRLELNRIFLNAVLLNGVGQRKKKKKLEEDILNNYRELLGLEFGTDCFFTIDGFHLKGSDTLRVSFTPRRACNLLGCYTTNEAQDNYSIYLTTTGKYLRYNGGSYNSKITAGDRYDVVVTPTGATGFSIESTWEEKSFTCPSEMHIGTTSATATSAKFDGIIYGHIVVDGRLDLAPVERKSDGAIGYLDLKSGVLYEPTEGMPSSIGYLEEDGREF